MPKFNLTVPHHLAQDEALKRIQSLLGNMKAQFAGQISDLQEEWTGNTGTFRFSAMGFPVSGTLAVKPSEVELSGDLPLLVSMYKGKIESMIRERAETLLA